MPSEREKVIQDIYDKHPVFKTALAAAYDAGRDAGYRQGVEDSAKAVGNEHLLDNTGIDTDIAYDSAVDDCLAAIRSLSPAEEANPPKK